MSVLEYVARSVGAEASYELRYLYELLYYLVWLLLYKPAESHQEKPPALATGKT